MYAITTQTSCYHTRPPPALPAVALQAPCTMHCTACRLCARRAERRRALPAVLAQAGQKFDYDLVIIGCGVGGHGAALHAVECVRPHDLLGMNLCNWASTVACVWVCKGVWCSAQTSGWLAGLLRLPSTLVRFSLVGRPILYERNFDRVAPRCKSVSCWGGGAGQPGRTVLQQ